MISKLNGSVNYTKSTNVVFVLAF